MSVPVDLARGPMGLSSPAVHHYHLRQLRRSLRRPSSSSDARPAALATSRTAEDPALPCSLPDPVPDGLVHGEREFDAIRAQLRAVEGVVAALQQRCDRAAATKEVVPWEMRRGAASHVGKSEHVGQASAAEKAESDDVPVVDSAAPSPETDGFASEHARTDDELHDECSEAPLCLAIVGPDLVQAALDVEAVDQGGVAEAGGNAREPDDVASIPASREARTFQRPVGIKAAAEFGLTRMTLRIQGWWRRLAVRHRVYLAARRLALAQGSSPAAFRAYREYCCSCGLSEEATESILRAVLQHEVTRQRELRCEAEQQKQADAFRRETLWLALDLRGAHAAIGKALHPRVFGAFFGWRQQYLAAKHARS